MPRSLRTARKSSALRPPGKTTRYESTEYRRIARDRERRLLRRLQRAYANDGLVLYLGAGVSASAGFPAWGELIGGMLEGVLARQAYGGNETYYEKNDLWPWRPETFARALAHSKLASRRPLIMVARLLRNTLKSGLPRAVAGSLYFQSMLGQWLVDDAWVKDYARGKASLDLDLMSSSLINTIAHVSKRRRGTRGIQAIVNYNFDDLVEEVIRQSGTPCTTLAGPGDRRAPQALPSYHVHGVLPLREYMRAMNTPKGWRSRGDFVFSEEQYHRQYSEPFRWSNLIQTSLLGSYDGLFVGLSLEDPNIRRLLDATHRQYPRRRNYAILRRQRPLARAGRNVREVVTNLIETLETDSFADLGVEILWVDDFKKIVPLLRAIAPAGPTE
jgi:hypothetical protein